ncbi:hypothetical protein LCGC14_2682050, partial [marine sediment metagenome]
SGLFAAKNIETLQHATCDVSRLLTMGYAVNSSLKLVCDRFSLTNRQRLAVMRSACSDEQLSGRRDREVQFYELDARPLVIDGYNVLITIEAVLSGGFIFIGRDGCWRDLASVHGSYRRVEETVAAVEIVGRCLTKAGVTDIRWLFDSPVSNSGKLKTLIAEIAEKNNWHWDIHLLTNPDSEMITGDRLVATADSVVLDKCKQWINLAAGIIQYEKLNANIIDLSGNPTA